MFLHFCCLRTALKVSSNANILQIEWSGLFLRKSLFTRGRCLKLVFSIVYTFEKVGMAKLKLISSNAKKFCHWLYGNISGNVYLLVFVKAFGIWKIMFACELRRYTAIIYNRITIKLQPMVVPLLTFPGSSHW